MKLPNTPDPQPTSNRGDYYHDHRLWNKRPPPSHESTRLLTHALDGNLTFKNIDEDIVGEGLEVVADGPFVKKKVRWEFSVGHPRIESKDQGFNVIVGEDQRFCIVGEENVSYDLSGGGTTITQPFSFKPSQCTLYMNSSGGHSTIVLDNDAGGVVITRNGITQEGLTAGTAIPFEILLCGQPGTAEANGNDFHVLAGIAGTGGKGGDIVLEGGYPIEGGNGGDIYLLPGRGLGPDGVNGKVYIGRGIQADAEVDYFASMDTKTGEAKYKQTQNFSESRMQVSTGADTDKPASPRNGEIYISKDKQLGRLFTR
tara:strand:+ start:131 stop:1069 length:939 start_codon:yes stop_codon:yes gene_type:complete